MFVRSLVKSRAMRVKGFLEPTSGKRIG